jgi:hypothetical protein
MQFIKEKEFTMLKKAILPLALMMASGAASAGVINGESELLTGSEHAQLSEWLGSDFDLTRIFAKSEGDTSVDWHAAVDGMGATFTVMEIFDKNTNESLIIGGYNSVSWSISGSYATSATAFLFNLSDDLLFEKNGRYSNGANAVLNKSNYAATFGAGHDLYVNQNLTNGYANIGNTYGDMTQYGSTSYREEFAGSYNNWTIGAYETYTLSASTGDFGTSATTDVPAAFLLGGLGLLGIAAARRNK